MSERWSELREQLAMEITILKRKPLEWILLSGNRLLVSVGLLAVVASILWWIVMSGLAPLVRRTPLIYLLFALISGNFTLITIVVSINQLVVTRHLESPGEAREHLQEILNYREEISKHTTENTIPVTPEGFFLLLFRNIDRDIHTLQSREWSSTAEPHQEGADMADLLSHAEDMIEFIEERSDGAKHALFLSLEVDYSRYFLEINRLQTEYADDMPESITDDLNQIREHIEHIDIARRYFVTIFLQSDLSSLSRHLLYIGIPVQITAVVLMLLFTATSNWVISEPVISLIIPLVVTVGFTPIILLTAYLIRMAMAVQRTVAMFPFTTQG